ncbi:MAG: hypothetical protein L6422_05650 [Candidatus Marinimicrobia bacterium]|nr:hypothetical protein [bacterium]MCG2715758.1 hypothetical protein [Candidatus Neomarinimicrobiota bacterium]
MTKLKKTNLNLKRIIGFLLENIDMISEDVPYWLLEMNNGIADPEIFNNADELEYEEIVDLLESALFSIFLFSIVENDVGEISIETSGFEELRQDYIVKVRQRLDIVYNLNRISTPFIKVKPFLIFWIGDVEIKISKVEKTNEQLLMSEVQMSQKMFDVTERMAN